MTENDSKTFTTAPKNGRRKNSSSPIRERCIRFIRILREMGYNKSIPVEDAVEVFQNEIGVMDAKSLRAYFGTRAGKSKKTMSCFKRYQNGNQSVRMIELSANIDEKQGYLEILGLADFDKKGKSWFMNVKSNFVVPLWSPQHCEMGDEATIRNTDSKERGVSKVEISLSSYEEKYEDGSGVNAESSAAIKLEHTHTTQREREKLSLENKKSPSCEEVDKLS